MHRTFSVWNGVSALALCLGLQTTTYAAGWTRHDEVWDNASTYLAWSEAQYAFGTASGSTQPPHAGATGLVYNLPNSWPDAYCWVDARARGGWILAVFVYDGMDPGTCPTTTHLDYQHVCDFHAFAAGENSRAEAWTHITVDPETGEPVAVDPFYAFAPVGTGDPVPEREDGANVIEYDPDVPPNNCSTWYYEWSYRRFRIYAGDPDNEQMHGDHAVNSQYFYQHGAILPNVNCDWCDEEVGYWDELNQRWVSGRGFYYPYGDGMGGEPSAVTIAWKTGGGSASGGAQTGSVLSYGAN